MTFQQPELEQFGLIDAAECQKRTAEKLQQLVDAEIVEIYKSIVNAIEKADYFVKIDVTGKRSRVVVEISRQLEKKGFKVVKDSSQSLMINWEE